MELGNVAEAMENFELAEKLFLSSLEIKDQMGDTEGIAFCYSNIGNLMCLTDREEDGINILYKAKEMHEKTGNTQGVLFSLIKLKKISEKKGLLDEVEFFDSEIQGICEQYSIEDVNVFVGIENDKF